MPLTQRSWWTLGLAGVEINQAPTLTSLSDVLIVDSGTSLVSGPRAKVAAVILALETESGVAIKETEASLGLQYSIKCVDAAKLAPVQVALALVGADEVVKKLTVTGESLVVGRISSSQCLLGISGSPDEGWILGDSWLRSFYTVYDYDNSAVGFAVAIPAEGLAAVIASGVYPPPSAYVLFLLLAVLIL
jgi:hypothetical protein